MNVHPTKMELRFRDGEKIYQMIYHAVSEALSEKELIPQVTFDKRKEEKRQENEEKKAEIRAFHPEPFEVKRRSELQKTESRERTAPKAEKPQMETPERTVQEREGKASSGGYEIPAAGQRLGERKLPWREKPKEFPAPQESFVEKPKEFPALRESSVEKPKELEKPKEFPALRESSVEKPKELPASQESSVEKPKQLDLFEEKLLSPESRSRGSAHYSDSRQPGTGASGKIQKVFHGDRL